MEFIMPLRSQAPGLTSDLVSLLPVIAKTLANKKLTPGDSESRVTRRQFVIQVWDGV